MVRWKAAPAFFRPEGVLLKKKHPSGVMNAVFSSSSFGHLNLVILLKGIQEAEEVASRRGIYNLIDPRKQE